MIKELPSVLQKDKKLVKAFALLPEPLPDFEKSKKTPDVYADLISSIVAQQLSTKAANTIEGRFLDMFSSKYPEPEKVLKMPLEKMRSAGLSGQKSAYIKNIAEFHIDKGIEYKTLKKLSDDEIIDYLSEIKGVGKWTVEMILIFSMKRPDVFPIDDLAIRQAVGLMHGFEDTKENRGRMLEIAEKWSPHRSLVSRILWRWREAVASK